MNNWSPTLRPPNMYIKCICWHFFFLLVCSCCLFIYIYLFSCYLYLLIFFLLVILVFFFFLLFALNCNFQLFCSNKAFFFFLFLPKGLREAALVLDLPTLHQISAFWLYFWLFFILLHFKLTFIYYHHRFIILFKIFNNFYQ